MTRSFELSGAHVGLCNRIRRALWGSAWLILYRPSPRPLHGWRRFLLRAFGARIERGAHPYPSSKIWAPWNLTMHEHSCLADHVDCYSVAPISLGAHATVSQYSYLCSASHDYRDPAMPLVAADVFVGPGVRIGEGEVVGARSTVTRDVAPWTVVAGSPAIRRGRRDPFKRPAS